MNVTVTALDGFNNTAIGYTGTVHFTSTDGQAGLPANSTLTSGARTFSVPLRTAGSQTVTATDTVTSSITGTSNTVSVTAATLDHFLVGVPSTATTGTAFSFTVSAVDLYSNLVSNYGGTVHFTSSDAAANLPANSSLTNGTASFRDALRATGFLCRNYFLFNRTTWLDETIEHTSRAFLGVTMQCTKCHDHKYNPVSQVDYYRMRAVFEPYHVRLDPAPGKADFARDGIPRVFDLHLDKATYVHKLRRREERRQDAPADAWRAGGARVCGVQAAARLTPRDRARARAAASCTGGSSGLRAEGNRARENREAAARLGYFSQPGVVAPAPDDVVRLHFALPDGNNSFIAALHHQIETQAKNRPDLDVRVDVIESFNPDTLARALSGLRGHAQGVGVIAIDHPTVREALRSLAAQNVEVVTIASDVHHVPRAAYIGIDNRAAGRLAGYLLSRFLGKHPAGKVALFAGSLSYRGHEEREMGFRRVLEEMSPSLQIVDLREMRDDWRRAYDEAVGLLDRHPDLIGIYNVGAGNTGIAQALKERGREHSTIFVGHEATDDTRELLLNGTLDAVIDQNPRVEAREALNILSHKIRGQTYTHHAPRLQVIFRENIPEV